MAFLEPLIAGLGEVGAGEAAGAGAAEGTGLGGAVRDFNDTPVGKMAGSIGGNVVAHGIEHGIGSVAHEAGKLAGETLGTGKAYERVNIGPMANLD